jgi:hypothetical protein
MANIEFREDLVIHVFDKATNKKVLYLVPLEVWKSEQFRIKDEESELGAVIDPLLNAGCVLATVPTTNVQSGGASCYLLSLSSLNVDPFGRNEELLEGMENVNAPVE